MPFSFYSRWTLLAAASISILVLAGAAPTPDTRPAARRPAAPTPELSINVWPGKPPGDDTPQGPDKWDNNSLTSVTVPTLQLFRPAKDKDTGAAMLVCPGGGFKTVVMYKEGYEACTWLNSMGITAILLRYRVPTPAGMRENALAMQDARRSMSLIRIHAADWRLDPHRIGMMGFSAGGQMTADTETNFDTLSYAPVDAIDKISNRPDLALCIYPGGIRIPDQPAEKINPDIKPAKNIPDTFICIATDDRNGSENAVYLYLALKKAGANVELHVYAEGNHGFGLRPADAPHGLWMQQAQEWMKYKGFFTPATAAK